MDRIPKVSSQAGGGRIIGRRLLVNRNMQITILATGVMIMALVFGLGIGTRINNIVDTHNSIINGDGTGEDTPAGRGIRKIAEITETNKSRYRTLGQNYNAFDSGAAGQDWTVRGNRNLGNQTAGLTVLDALPDQYRRFELRNDLRLFLSDQGFQEVKIEVPTQSAAEFPDQSINPQTTEIRAEISLTVSGGQELKHLLDVLDRSIRPIKINRISVNYNNSEDTTGERFGVVIGFQTYYQPRQTIKFDKALIGSEDENGSETESGAN